MLKQEAQVAEMTPHRFETLDGLRGVAAIGVLVGHATMHLPHNPLPLFFSAVDLFFILSGFVIAEAYSERLRQGMPISSFLAKRVIRLYPMFIVSLVLGAIGLLLCVHFNISIHGAIDQPTSSVVLRSAVVNAFFIPYLRFIGPGTQSIFPANNPGWSLFYEMIASALFVFLYRLSPGRLAAFSAACFAVLIALTFIDASSTGHLDFGPGWSRGTFIAGFPRCFYGFSLGVAIRGVLPALRRLPGFRLPPPPLAKPWMLYVLLIAVMAMPDMLHGGWFLLIILLIAPLIVIWGAQCPTPSPVSLRTAQALGWLSYPLYCIHFPVMRLVAALLHIMHRQDQGRLAAILSFIVAIVIAFVVGKLIDEPARSWLTRKLRERARAAPEKPTISPAS